MEDLFTYTLDGWASWGQIFQSKEAFAPLAREILRREGLPPAELASCTPGTNAVFRAGKYVLKVFAPAETGVFSLADYETEIGAMRIAAARGAAIPKLIAQGSVEDRYRFYYIVMEHLPGEELERLREKLTPEEKRKVGRRLRRLTDQMNHPVKPFNTIDIFEDESHRRRWQRFEKRFLAERSDYLQQWKNAARVFVHGDLNGDNILLTPNLTLRIIDFADAVLAPVQYEHAVVAAELFRFDRDYLQGYFGDYDPVQLAQHCMDGLLMHAFGADIITQRLCPAEEVPSIRALRDKLIQRLQTGC